MGGGPKRRVKGGGLRGGPVKIAQLPNLKIPVPSESSIVSFCLMLTMDKIPLPFVSDLQNYT